MQGLKEDRTCYYCGIKGHLKAACWAWKRQNEWRMEGYKREAKNSALTLEKDNDEKEDFIGFNKEMVVDVCIEGQPARLLIDSGSEVTLIRNDFMDKVENKGKVYPGRYHTIIGVGGNQSKVIGATVLSTTFYKREVKVEFHIVEVGHYDGILGRDFLGKNIHTISCAEQRMYFKSVNSTKEGHIEKTDKKS